MRITQLHLKHFGKFEDTRIRFTSGINIICGGNETGKSTIHAFIRAMLFGLDRGRGHGGQPGEYQLREPWENSAYYAGSMWVEDGGKTYRIERNFSRGSRSLRVIDEAEGLQMADPEGALRQMLQGADAQTYERTLYIPQAGALTEEKMFQTLTTSIVSANDGGDGLLDVQAALDYLKKYKKKVLARKEQSYALLEEKIARKKTEEELVRRDLESLKQELEKTRAAGGRGLSRRESEEAAAGGRGNWAGREGGEAGASAGSSAFTEESEEGKERLTDIRLLRLLSLCVWTVAVLGFLCMVILSDVTVKVLTGAIGGLFLIIGVLMRISPRGFGGKAGRWNRYEQGTTQRTTQTAEEMDSAGETGAETGADAFHEKQIRAKKQSLEQISRELQDLYRQTDDLRSYDVQAQAMDLAMSRIQELSSGTYREKGKDQLKMAGQILSELTDGRYDAISVDEKGRVRINTPDRLLELSQVSFGTMQQINLALRLSAAAQAGLTDVPFVLDETFAMYDDERLKLAMEWLYHSGRQVILFSCQTREKRILDEVKAEMT